MDLAGFQVLIETHFQLEAGSLHPDLRLRDQPIFDSLGMLELVLLLETFGSAVPEALIPALITLDDVWTHYCRHTGVGG